MRHKAVRNKGKILFLWVLLTFACRCGASEADVCKWPPEHDWTISVGSHRFGLSGSQTQTVFSFGWGSFTVGVPFYAAAAGAGLTLAVAAGIYYFLRRSREPVSAQHLLSPRGQ